MKAQKIKIKTYWEKFHHNRGNRREDGPSGKNRGRDNWLVPGVLVPRVTGRLATANDTIHLFLGPDLQPVAL